MIRGMSPHDVRVVEIQVRLVAEEAMPVVRLGLRVPGPVGTLGVAEDDPRPRVALRGVTPDVVVALGRAGRGAPRRLEPGVGVGGVIENQLGDDPQVTPVRLAHEGAELRPRAVLRVDVAVVGDVVAVVAPRGGVERQQPQCVDAEVLDVVELARQAGEVAAAVVVAVEEGADVHLVDDRILEPQGIAIHGLSASRDHAPASFILRVASILGVASASPRRAAAAAG